MRFAAEKKIFCGVEVEKELNIPRMCLHRLVQAGKLSRVGRGLYSLSDGDFTEHQSQLEVAAKVPKAVLCLLSALAFYDLTTQNPFEVWFAIPRDSHIPKVETVQTRIFRFAPTVYSAGVETHLIEGVTIKVYSPAKTVADCFYYQRTVGLDVALEALRDAWNARRATMDELYHFAQVRNRKSVMLPYLNTLG